MTSLDLVSNQFIPSGDTGLFVFFVQLFEEVTILFGYLDEFNTVCSYAQPTVVIGLVNTMFVLFDKLCETHGIYKVSIR